MELAGGVQQLVAAYVRAWLGRLLDAAFELDGRARVRRRRWRKISPARGPIWIVRSSALTDAKPATPGSGPAAPRSRSGSTGPCRTTGRRHRRRRCRDRDARTLARREHRCAGGQRLANRTLVDGRAGGLVGPAEEDVRGAADRAARRSASSTSAAASAGRRERLLGIDVLACLEGRPDHGGGQSGGVRFRITSIGRIGKERLTVHRHEAVACPSASLRTGRDRRTRRCRTSRTRGHSRRIAG